MNKTFWVDAELKLYVIEALQTWNSLAAFYKDRDSLTTSPNQPYYDLPSSLSAGLRAYNVTDLQLLTEIEYHLMEPPTGATWTGSEMFTVQDILTALQRRRDQFLNETGTVLTRKTFAVSAPTEGRVLLTLSSPFNIIDIRRVAWKDTPSGQYSTLWRESRDALDFFFASWKTSTKPLPKVYSVSDTQPLQIQLAPIPSDAGTLEVLTVNTGNTLTGTGTLMGVPDNLVWIIKFGALADLLQKDGPARDPGRAEYCNKRWEQGVAAAKMPLSTISCLVQDQPVNTESVFDLDVYRANWQNAGTGLPTIAGLAGLNLMALSPTPNSFYTVQVDLLRNMPIPVGDGDFIQVGSEMVDAVLRYALHLAMFKSGGAEFSTTMPDLKQFIDLAIEQNSRLRANDAFITMTMDRSELEEKQRARLSS